VSTEAVEFNAFKVEELEPIGNGFWLAKDSCGSSLLHQSGFQIGDGCIADAKVIASKYIAIQVADRWTLWAMNGTRLTTQAYDDITNIGDVIVFLKDKRYRLATTMAVAASANQQQLRLSDGFDAIKPWRSRRLWLRAGVFEGIMDQSLNIHIGFEEGVLEETFFGTLRRSGNVQLFNEQGNKMNSLADVQCQAPWVLGKQSTQWHLLDATTGAVQGPGYDSAFFKGPFVMASSGDTTRVYFDQATHLDFFPSETIEFIPGQDSSAFLAVSTRKGKVLYGEHGKKMFSFTADKIQHAGQQYFIITKKDKKGVVDATGKALTPYEFDAVGSSRNASVSLLKSMRFGLFSLKSRKLIDPLYTKNIMQYNADILTAYKNGAWGFIDWHNKPIGNFEFQEIQFWNDSLALVRKNEVWSMIEIKTQQVVLEGIKSIKRVHDSSVEKVVIVDVDGKFGVLSNRRGVVIPINFTDLVNVGSPEMPVFFTEKHVEEASVFVVIYYSASGKFLRKEVYEADDYERIYCSE
jgi:hypothetical protein